MMETNAMMPASLPGRGRVCQTAVSEVLCGSVWGMEANPWLGRRERRWRRWPPGLALETSWAYLEAPRSGHEFAASSCPSRPTHVYVQQLPWCRW